MGYFRLAEGKRFIAVRFLGFAGAQVLGIRPIVEGVQSVANRLEQFGLRARHVFFLRDFHQPRVLFPSPKEFQFFVRATILGLKRLLEGS
jgi:hypothetical protein